MPPADPLPTQVSASGGAFGYAFGPYRIDVATYQVCRDDEPLSLPSKAFDTLLVLVRERHRVVTKDELLAAVWRDANVTDDSLTQAISAIRKAVGDDTARQAVIATVARRGYRFVAPVTEWTAPPGHPSVAASPSPPAAPAPTVEPAPAILAEATPDRPAPRQADRAASTSGPRGRVVWVALLVVALGVGLLLGRRSASSSRPAGGADSGPSSATGLLRFQQAAPAGLTLSSGGALAPDGSALAFAAADPSGRTTLWVRPLDTPTPRALEGTDGAARPFWSPDGQWIGFFAQGQLRIVPASGGPVTTLATIGPRPTGGAWNARGQILFGTWGAGFSVLTLSGGGTSGTAPGAATRVTQPAAGEAAQAWPQFLPDGNHFLYSTYGARGGVYLASLDRSTPPRRLLDADAGAVYSPDGYLVFTRGGVLTAQPFTPETLSLAGEAFVIAAGNVVIPTMTNGTLISAARGGLLAVGGATGESELAWFDRGGRRLGAIPAPVELHNPALTADGGRLLANSYPPGQPGVWMVDLARGVSNRIAPDASIPVPSPDGNTLAIGATRDGQGQVLRLTLGAPSDAGVKVTAGPEPRALTHWSDSGTLIFQVQNNRGDQDLWTVPANGGEARPLLAGPANDIQGRLSPDGRWLAWASDESGGWQVYVQAFPDGGRRQTISPAGGAEPQWRADGRELFYLADDRTLMAVDVRPGSTLGVSTPRALFRPKVQGEATTYRSHYAVSRDGQRFVVDVLRPIAFEPLTLLLNWDRRP